jgi:hypothetical protein
VTGYQTADFLQVLIARHFEKERGPSVVSVGNCPGFDIRWKNGTAAEVKLDTLAAKTFNACIEFWNNRKNCPSGILATNTDVWLHCVPEGNTLRCYEVNTKRLLRLCLETGRVENGGDFGASMFKLIPMAALAQIANDTFKLEGELVVLALETR